MATKTTVTVEILAALNKANQQVVKFASDTQKRLDDISFKQTISSIKDGLDLAKQAFQDLEKLFNSTVGEAEQFEVGARKLGQAMKLTGDFTESAVNEFKDFADSLQRTSGYQDEVILGAAAMAKTFNLTNDETKKAVSAATDLAAALNIDLDTAVQKVSRTYQGFVDRDIAKVVPALKTLSKEQLTAGEGATILADRFRGTAEALKTGLSGGKTDLNNNLRALGKTIGEIFLPAVNSAVKSLNDFFDAQRKVKDDLIAQTLLEKAANNLQNGVQGIGDLKLNEAIKARKDLEDKAANEARARQRLLEQERIAAEERFQALKPELERAGLQDIEKIQTEFAQKRKTINDALYENDARTQAARIKFLGNLQREEDLAVAKERKRIRDEEFALTAQASAQQFDLLLNQQGKGRNGADASQNQRTAAVVGVASNALAGQAGAVKVAQNFLSAFADTLIPGIGGIVGQIIAVFAQGPEKVKQFIEEFIRSIPVIITNIVEAIPVAITTVVKEIPKTILEFLKNGLPEFIKRFVESIPQLIIALVEYIPQIAIALVQGIISGLPQIIAGFARALVQAAGDFVRELVHQITNVGGLFSNIFGGIGDFFSSLNPFADGGRIPDRAQFANDNAVIRASAGEQILSKDLSQRLEQFLNGGGGGGGTQTIILQIGQRELARVLLDTNQRGFRTA